MSLSERLAVGPGDLVALRLPPGPAWLRAVTDLWAAGAAILPLDVRLSSSELRAIIALADPGVIESAEGTQIRESGASVDERVGLVMPTSGTSGEPKLAELSKEAVSAALHSSTRALGADVQAPWVACLTPAHVGGMLVLLRAAMLGTPVIVHDRFDPGLITTAAAIAEADRPVHVSLVPTMVHRLVFSGIALHGLTLLVGGGELESSTRTAAERSGARVVTTYGLTETSGGVAYDGRPFPGTDVRVAADGGVELRGPTVMRGYRRDPQATAQAFTRDGWLRTGDIGSVDEDGRIEIRGRADDLIRTGAEKVWPIEVERALADHPKVADVAVRGAADPQWGQHVTAFVVPEPLEDPPSLRELQTHVEGRLARFKFPRELVLCAEIPRTASGKVRRRDLR
ncbi:MAG: o-succinylbenzoate---CoA ligase [Actinomycetota bacterium]|nr:o-succinylbenzoate---CoA ligase [Actinomycetota bacterium]